jgi:hypothetical protein
MVTRRSHLKHFLIVLDRTASDEPVVTQFRRPTPALLAYRDAEEEFRHRPDVQVVLIASDSIETVKKTHGNYWPDSVQAELRDFLSLVNPPRTRKSKRLRRRVVTQ